jgi:hypothetical protein
VQDQASEALHAKVAIVRLELVRSSQRIVPAVHAQERRLAASFGDDESDTMQAIWRPSLTTVTGSCSARRSTSETLLRRREWSF